MKPFRWKCFQIILPRNYSLALKPSVVIPRWCSLHIPWQRGLPGQIHGRDGIWGVEFPNVFSCLTQYFVKIILPLFLPYSSRCIISFCDYGLSFKVTNHGPVENLCKGCFHKDKDLIKESLLNLAKYVTVISLFFLA